MICVMIAAAAFTYKVKHDAEEQLAEMKKVQSEIRFERETIDVLKADWSLLSQPSRLQRLSGGGRKSGRSDRRCRSGSDG